MALLQGECESQRERQTRIYNNPFARRMNSRLQRAPIQEYIKAWIEDIFYNNKKIDIQAKASIYRKLISDKFYELSSCSIIYSIIREKIREICLRLRSFINLSYHALHAQHRFLSALAGNGGGECLHGAVARGYVMAYRYMCQVAKETFNFWKILYECAQVKDLRFNSLQSSLNQFILDTFVQPSGIFDPRLLLPAMTFPQKCKFIYAEADGIKKREELTHFYEDDTVKRLLKPQVEETGRIRAELAGRSPEERWSVARKYEMFHKPRMDLKELEHLRKYYLDPEAQAKEEALFSSLFPQQSSPPDTAFSQEKLDLIRSLENNHEQLFEIEDASSQEDGGDPLFYDDNQAERQDLLQEQDNIEIDLAMNPEKQIQPAQSDGSTKSEPNDEPPEQHDLPMRNYENEPPPPEFIMAEHSREEGREEVRRAIELLSHYSQERPSSSSSSDGKEEKMAKLKVNIAKSKQIRQRDRKVQFLDKRQLQEEKEKLEKYRKELQKEKQELLRQVQKFMKEKKKETDLRALMTDKKARYKFSRNYKCSSINHKIIHKLEKHQQKIESITLNYELRSLENQEQLRTQPNFHCSTPQPLPLTPAPQTHTHTDKPFLESIEQFINDHAKMKEIQQAASKDLFANEVKLTKKQQKLKKKLEHEASLEESPKLETKKSERSSITEQEAALTNFLERLRIEEDTRLPCNVEQQQLQRWRARAALFRKDSPALINPPSEPTVVQEMEAIPAKAEPTKKRKKHKR